MPVYLFEAEALSEASSQRALSLAASRFPELDVERRYAEHDGKGDLWVCRAPSPDRVARWADAAGIAIHHVRRMEAQPLRPATTRRTTTS